MSIIFISYDNDDCGSDMETLWNGLAQGFGELNVFFGVKSVDAGERVSEKRRLALHTCYVMIPVIGPNWSSRWEQSRRADDSVRTEIQTALQRGIGILPVALREPVDWNVIDLPSEIEPLNDFQHFTYRHDDQSRDEQLRGKVLATLIKTIRIEHTLSASPGLLPNSVMADQIRCVLKDFYPERIEGDLISICDDLTITIRKSLGETDDELAARKKRHEAATKLLVECLLPREIKMLQYDAFESSVFGASVPDDYVEREREYLVDWLVRDLIDLPASNLQIASMVGR